MNDDLFTYVMRVIDDADYLKALDLLGELEDSVEFSKKEELTSKLLKATIFSKLSKFNESIQLSEEVYKKAQSLNLPYYSIDALLIKEETLLRMSDLDESLKVINEAERLISGLSSNNMLAEKKAILKRHKGGIYNFKGNTDKAIELTIQSLELAKNAGVKKDIAACLNNLGVYYNQLADLTKALEYYIQSREIFDEIGSTRERAVNSSNIGWIYGQLGKMKESLKFLDDGLEKWKEIGDEVSIGNQMGTIGYQYYRMGNIDKAIEYLDQGLRIARKFGKVNDIGMKLFHLLLCYYNLDNLETARKFSEEMFEVITDDAIPLLDHMKRFGKALVLKMSPRMTEKAKAQEILQELTNEQFMDSEIRYYVLMSLCDLLIYELRSYGEKVVSQQIESILNDMQILSNKINSPEMIINTLILKSKLSLINGELKQAEEILEDAKVYSDDLELIQLKNWVNHEKTILYKELDKWIELMDQNTPMKDRVKQARLEEYISRVSRFLADF